jgi:hypothetical protein
MKANVHHYDLSENFVFSDKARKSIFIILALGIVFFVIGLVMVTMGGGHEGHDHALAGNGDFITTAGGEDGHSHGHAYHWTSRLKVTLWHNSLFFLGIAVIGIFFTAIQYAAHAGWSALIKRVPEAFGSFVPYAGVVLLAVFFWGGHEIFHWTDASLYDPKSDHYDEIMVGKRGFLNTGVFLTLTILFIGGWFGFWYAIRSNSKAEDLEGGTKRFWKMKVLATLFIIFFAVSSSVSAWLWIMSIDSHWFSTMFGWYNFASYFVAGLATITLAVIYLHEAGYLKALNENHLHDLGKFVFAFSIFWSYIWFSQFLLIYYANLSEETVYFWERLRSPIYGKFVFINLFLNFVFPFLSLMTRDAKRKTIILKIVCYGVIIGHWIDFWLMITPGTLKEHGGLGFLEIGLGMIYAAAFAFVVANALTKAPLIARNHPMMQESLHHNI